MKSLHSGSSVTEEQFLTFRGVFVSCLLFFQLVLAWRALRAERTHVPAPAEFFRGSCANCVWPQKTDNSNLQLPESKLKPEDMMLFGPARKDGVLLR
ncbi:hypothetical protein DTO217A2_5463 [Paecilomyces variotii]|nr:hypothetical protein DTO217A2_5463 [Paecilomyces variotii]